MSDDPLTDDVLDAAIHAMEPDRIQGFTYGQGEKRRHVIRDVFLQANDIIWSGPAQTKTDENAFHRQCDRERIRIGIAAALRAMPKGTAP